MKGKFERYGKKAEIR